MTDTAPVLPSTEILKKKLIQEAVDQGVLKFGEFTLKSGRTSPYFFNAGLFNTGKSLEALAANYAALLASILLEEKPGEGAVIFGPAYKGIPLVAATTCLLQKDYGQNVAWGFNRKEAKDHGEGGLLVGAPVQDRPVWIIDDVITAGTAIREVVEILQKNGARIAGVVVALDRQERGTGALSAIQELQQTLQIPVHAIMNLSDIMQYAHEQGLNEHHERMLAYRQQYGV